MFKKAVLFTVFLVAFGFGTAFANQIDSLASSTATPAPTNVYVNPGGLGDVLLYGYYNVRDNNSTFFTVTNTDQTNGARVRIRFREAATLGAPVCNGSQEVLDFDICLTPGDMWSGEITTDSATGAAVLISSDMDTYISPADQIFSDRFPTGAVFAHGDSNLGITAEQTREGYFEVIAEDGLDEVSSAGTCGPNLRDNSTDVGNVLMGHAYNVNLSNTQTFGYAATALADFSLVNITSAVTTPRPNLRDDSEDTTIDPVNYALTKSQVMGIYDLEAGVTGKTNLVITFPTKALTHTESVVDGECVPNTDDIFDDPRVAVTIFDDAENSPTTVCDVSPCPAGTFVELPHEVNLVKINAGSNIFVSDVETLLSTNFAFGWINIDMVTVDGATLPVPQHETSLGGQTTHGLPAIGYALHNFASGTFTGLIPLQYTSNVTLLQ